VFIWGEAYVLKYCAASISLVCSLINKVSLCEILAIK